MQTSLRKTAACLAAAVVAGSLLLGTARGAGAAETAAAPVTLRADTTIVDDLVRLRDIFDGIDDARLADTPVARAPEPGVSVEVGARWLYAVAQAHALPWQPRSPYDSLSLTRASRDVSTQEIESALRNALADQGLHGDVQLTLDNPDLTLRLPSNSNGGVRVTRVTLDQSSGRFVAQAVAPAGGEPVTRLSITGRAVALTEVPVLSRNVRPGEVIRDRDITWISVQANRLTRTSIVDSADIVGMTPRRAIRAEDIVRSTDLQTPIMVTKNSLVTIRLQTDRMQLTVQGRAMEAGAEGEVVRVMNTKSNAVVNAVVVDGGTVEVVPARITAER